jgi:hypothetical protein
VADAGGRSWITTFRDAIIGASVLGFTLATVFGVTGRVEALNERVHDLELQGQQIDANEARIAELQGEVQQLEHARQDILEAICAVAARDHHDVSRCVRAAG